MNITFDNETGDAFWIEGVCGIYRWYASFLNRPGTYRVVALSPAYEYMKFTGATKHVEPHPTCVVDDFGNLVRIQ